MVVKIAGNPARSLRTVPHVQVSSFIAYTEKLYTESLEIGYEQFQWDKRQKMFDERKMTLFYENIEQKFGIRRKEDVTQLTAVRADFEKFRRVRK